ncbi:MAG TPA: cytochrome c [Acetobacteraceae bacterium]|nr:cytochrome c [Acetobacteraceae bacterium]
MLSPTDPGRRPVLRPATMPLVAMAAVLVLALAIPLVSAREEPARAASRGEYLSRIMDCGGCHTGGALIGQPDPRLHLAGSAIGFAVPGLGVFYPPNLTPDRETGLGAWSEDDIIRAVRTGVRPDGRILAPAMPWHAYAALTNEDARALARYLRALPPIRNAAPPITGEGETPPAPYFTVVTPGR